MAVPQNYPLRRAIIETIRLRGISQAALRRQTGIGQVRLWRYLTGKRDMLAGAFERLRVALGLIIVDPISEPEE